MVWVLLVGVGVGGRDGGGGGGGRLVVYMSDVNFNRCPCCLSLTVLDKYHFIPLE